MRRERTVCESTPQLWTDSAADSAAIDVRRRGGASATVKTEVCTIESRAGLRQCGDVDLITAVAGSGLVYLVVFGLCVLDGLVPPIPSETAIVVLAALSASTGRPSLLLLGLVAASGAALGDNLAYAVGAKVGVTRFAWMRRPRIARSIEGARRQLRRRPAAVLLIGRYVPVGRVVVNMTAGATGLPRRHFIPLSAIGGTCWAGYMIGLGVLAAACVRDHPLLGMGAGIVFSTVLGVAIDRIRRRAAKPGVESDANRSEVRRQRSRQ